MVKVSVTAIITGSINFVKLHNQKQEFVLVFHF